MSVWSLESLPGRVVFGPGVARTALPVELGRLGATRVLVIATDRELSRMAAPLSTVADEVAGTFTAVRQHVPVETARAAREHAARVRADAVLAVGGGSSLGTAKAIALTTGLPIVAVPTTYAGSEMTPVWGLTEDARKTTGRDPRVLPRTVLYDPELTVSLPADVSAASGLNALAHAVEAFWAPGANPVTSVLAEEAIRALAGGLPGVVADRTDLAARTQALYGAYLAGSAFAVAGSGLHHKICHVLGGRYNLPHAGTHAVVLAHVLAFNAPAVPDVAARITAALDTGTRAGLGTGTGTWAGLDTGTGTPPEVAVADLARRLGAPASLAALGLSEGDIDGAADEILPAVPASNPRPVGRADLVDLLTAALAGPIRPPRPTTSTSDHSGGPP
jgi:maleylacetate reductase